MRRLAPLGALVVAAFFVPLKAVAQTPPSPPGDLSRGATLPPTSAAFANEATSLSINPAGLSGVRSAQLFYLHDRTEGPFRVANSLFLADTFFKAVSLGLSHEWIRREGADYRMWSWGLSVGTPQFSVGAAFHNPVSSEDAQLSRLHSWDVGLQAKPLRALSVGFTARNLNNPSSSLGTYALGRQYVTAIGFRPWREYITLGVDWWVPDAGGFDSSRLSYTLQARPWRGVGLLAGLSHGISSSPARDNDLRAQVGISADLPNLGVTYVRGITSNFDSDVIAIRLSAQPYHQGFPIGGNVALLDLSALLKPQTSPLLSLLGLSEEDPFLRLALLLEEARKDSALRGLVLKIDGLPEVGLGKAEELRQAILRFRASGKKVIAYLHSVSDADYLVASAADQIYAAPEASLFLDGFAAQVTFFGGAMEKLGVHWDVARVGAYKNSPDALTRSSMSTEQKEALNAYLDSGLKLFDGSVTQTRELPANRMEQVRSEALIPPRRAQALKLIDDVVAPPELKNKLKTVIPGTRFVGAYHPPKYREDRWGLRPRIAVIPVIGTIADGRSRQDPLGMTSIAGSDTIRRALERATADPTIRAIVLRIDSPGGSGLASDLIYRSVLEAKKHKPVIASMGDLAASGGYYVAMGADEILATPATLTGSIGVFLIKPALQGLGEKLGIRTETVERGPMAHILGIHRPWTEQERSVAQRWIDSFYDGFISEVASSRKLQKSEVDSVARGRIWSGEDARSRKLVDRTGGLFEALQSAQARAGISESNGPDWVLMGEPAGLLASMTADSTVGKVAGKLLGPVSPGPIPILAELSRELGVDGSFLLEAGVKARLPYGLQIR